MAGVSPNNLKLMMKNKNKTSSFSTFMMYRNITLLHLFLLSLFSLGLQPFSLFGQATDTDNDGVPDSTDLDDDGDGLIEIRTLAELNNVRYNLGGTGYRTTELGTYDAVFVADNLNYEPGNTTGCPSTGARNACKGYELMANLDFADKTAPGYNPDWDPTVQKVKPTPGPGFPPIGNYSLINPRASSSTINRRHFMGIFEGNNHTIANLYVNASSSSDIYAGLFGRVASATPGNGQQVNSQLRNLGLTGEHMSVSARSSGGSCYVGGLVGYVFAARGGNGVISQCYSTGDVFAFSNRRGASAGGLVGQAFNSSTGSITMTNCYATGNVTGGTAGGLLGYLEDGDSVGRRTTISHCYATGNVTGVRSDSGAGGLIGAIYAISTNGIIISDSYATGDASAKFAGGFLSEATGSAPFKIMNSYATGNVKSRSSGGLAGGFLGHNTISVVSGSYATGDVSAVDRGNAGGLVSFHDGGSVSDSYATGKVSGGGGLTGYAYDPSTVTGDRTAEVRASQGVRLAQKANGLTKNAQTYTATFASGTLYYLLMEGGFDPSITKAMVKMPESRGVGANKGSIPATGDLALTNLAIGTRYTLYVMLEASRRAERDCVEDVHNSSSVCAYLCAKAQCANKDGTGLHCHLH